MPNAGAGALQVDFPPSRRDVGEESLSFGGDYSRFSPLHAISPPDHPTRMGTFSGCQPSPRRCNRQALATGSPVENETITISDSG